MANYNVTVYPTFEETSYSQNVAEGDTITVTISGSYTTNWVAESITNCSVSPASAANGTTATVSTFTGLNYSITFRYVDFFQGQIFRATLSGSATLSQPPNSSSISVNTSQCVEGQQVAVSWATNQYYNKYYNSDGDVSNGTNRFNPKEGNLGPGSSGSFNTTALGSSSAASWSGGFSLRTGSTGGAGSVVVANSNTVTIYSIPSAPSALSPSNLGSTSFTANATAGTKNYGTLQVRINGGAWQSNGHTFTGLAANTTYIVDARQLNTIAESGLTTINVTTDTSPPPNQNPVANNDSFTTAFNTPVSGNVLSNDSDPDNNALTVTANSNPSHGTLSIFSNGNFTYTPNNNFSGNDSFDYDISDGAGGTASATVTITVGAAPITQPVVNNTQTFDTTTEAATFNHTISLSSSGSGGTLQYNLTVSTDRNVNNPSTTPPTSGWTASATKTLERGHYYHFWARTGVGSEDRTNTALQAPYLPTDLGASVASSFTISANSTSFAIGIADPVANHAYRFGTNTSYGAITGEGAPYTTGVIDPQGFASITIPDDASHYPSVGSPKTYYLYASRTETSGGSGGTGSFSSPGWYYTGSSVLVSMTEGDGGTTVPGGGSGNYGLQIRNANGAITLDVSSRTTNRVIAGSVLVPKNQTPSDAISFPGMTPTNLDTHIVILPELFTGYGYRVNRGTNSFTISTLFTVAAARNISYVAVRYG